MKKTRENVEKAKGFFSQFIRTPRGWFTLTGLCITGLLFSLSVVCFAGISMPGAGKSEAFVHGSNYSPKKTIHKKQRIRSQVAVRHQQRQRLVDLNNLQLTDEQKKKLIEKRRRMAGLFLLIMQDSTGSSEKS